MVKNIVVRHLMASDARKIRPIEDNFEEIVADCLNRIYEDIEKVSAWGWVETVFSGHWYSQKVVIEVENVLLKNGYDVKRLFSKDNGPDAISGLTIRWE